MRDDPRVIAQLATVFCENSRSEDGLRRRLTQDEAVSLARRVVDRILSPDCAGVVDVGGMRFFLELGDDLYPGPNRIIASAWDGVQWRPVGSIPLPGGTG